MPWQTNSVAKQRWRFAVQAQRMKVRGFAGLCRRFRISRKTGYKWLQRWAEGGQHGLADRSRRPKRQWQFESEWRPAVLALHQQHYRVGADKLKLLLRELYPGQRVPASRTIHRWLKHAQRVRAVAPPGPALLRERELLGRRPNDVWTVDFKGWFRTTDGTLVQLLTVRDLASRYILAACHLSRVDERSVWRCLQQLFRRYGLPKAIRVDRGAPFCGDGPRRWSRLSVRWIRLGIAVQITRRARPDDNGAHEQMHRMLKDGTAAPPARTLRSQRHRTEQWRRWYNDVRPHQSLGDRRPAELYRSSPRTWPAPLRPLCYPSQWSVHRVDLRGYICWRGQRRQIGRAFYRQPIALRLRPHHIEVYFGPYLLGAFRPHEHLIRSVHLSSLRRFR